MARTAPMETDLVDAVASRLMQDEVVGAFSEGHIGGVGTFENLPRYIEIGYTSDDSVANSPNKRQLVTIHVWSKSDTTKEIHDVLRAAEQAISAMDNRLAPKREFSEVRYDDRHAAYHGLLRLSLSPGGVLSTPENSG